MTLRKNRSGVVLLVVLLLLLMLGVLATSLLTSAAEAEQASTLAVSQRVAASRADQAAQIAIATISSGTISTTGMIPCEGPVGQAGRTAPMGGGVLCSAGANMITSGMINGPVPTKTLGFEQGAGLQYQWWIYQRPVGPGVLPSTHLVRVYAEGYWGSATNSPNFTVASVEADVLIPDLSGGSGDSSDSFVYGGGGGT
jgi:hypothetical protein